MVFAETMKWKEITLCSNSGKKKFPCNKYDCDYHLCHMDISKNVYYYETKFVNKHKYPYYKTEEIRIIKQYPYLKE